MKLRRKLTISLLFGAMLALPMIALTAPAFSESAYGTDSNSIQQVDWWWDHYHNDREGYANRGWHHGYYEYGGHRNPCERARELQNQVWQDRSRGHPAAARDVEEEAAAARARCYHR